MPANALQLEQWPIGRLVEYERNPRKNDDVVDRMAQAIVEFGFRIPIVARSDGLVVDGHLRLKAARLLGLDTVPVVLADELSETQIKAFRLLANQSANWAEWDEALLSAFRGRFVSGLHAVGTCRMGDDDMAVVDGDLRVRGVAGLRVVDASVMPAPVSGNTNGPVMALARVAAERIIGGRG